MLRYRRVLIVLVGLVASLALGAPASSQGSWCYHNAQAQAQLGRADALCVNGYAR